MTNPMTDQEWLNWNDTVKCNWLTCAGGCGLAGNGCCSFRGDFRNENCPKFITDEEYEKRGGSYSYTTSFQKEPMEATDKI